MGIGKSGEQIDPKKIKIKIGNFLVTENGKISESYDEEKLKEYMKWDSIEIEVNLKLEMMHLNVTLVILHMII